MATKASGKATDVVQDTKQLLQRAKKELPALLKEDAKKGKTKGTDMAFVKALEADVAAYGGAATTQRGKTTTARAATKTEEKLRADLATELRSIRDDVKDANSENLPLQKEFGRGRKLEGKTTNGLLDAADAFVAAFDTHEATVKSAGVTKKRIDKLLKLRDALAEADANQRGEAKTRVGATTTKVALLAKIVKGAARLRGRLGKGQPATKAVLTTTSRKRAVKKRAPKKAPVG